MEGSALPTRIAATTASGAPVSLRGVTKGYGGVRAVRDTSLDIAAGEFLSLLGPSGSGKTTVLMMIAGFETPDAGAIIVGGRDVTFIEANRREVGMVFQRYALFPHMTVAQNIAFPLEMRRLSRGDIAARVEEALVLVQLEGYGGRLPAQLSGGQQQRVALARAVVFRPPVLLMDEPLAALDRKLRQAMQLELKRLQQKLGLTVIYVTHDQEEALTMSDRVVVLRDGRVEQVGRPEELYEQPINAFVAGFIGESNFFDGEIVEVDGSACSVRLAIGGTAPACLPSSLAIGSRVRLAVRPERVQLNAPSRGLDGIVTDHVYAGADVTLVVRVGDAIDVLLRRAADALDAQAAPIGRRVGVTWAARDARAYHAADRAI